MCRKPVAPRLLLHAILLSFIANRALCGGVDITWTSPSDGDVFGPGDAIIGKWNADQAVVSPSFRLCMTPDSQGVAGDTGSDVATDGSCGSTVWPAVEQSAGSYFISLSIPNVTSEAGFYLQMEDDFGKVVSSPNFSLSPTATETANVEGDPSQVDPPSPSLVPPSAPPVSPVLSATRKPPPTAAFVVPISVVGAILIVAIGLSLHHRKMLQKESSIEKEKPSLSRRSSLTSFESSSAKIDAEALHVLSRNGLTYGSGAVDHFTEYTRAPRQSTRQPFPTYASSMGRSTRTTSYNGKRARPLRGFRSSSNLQDSSPASPTARSTRPLVRGRSSASETTIDSVIMDYFDSEEPLPPSPPLSTPETLYTRREVSKFPYTYQDDDPNWQGVKGV